MAEALPVALRTPAPRPAAVIVADYREGRSLCLYCASSGSMAEHAGAKDPEFVLLTCRGCGAAFWILRAEFERMAYRGQVALPEDAARRVVLA